MARKSDLWAIVLAGGEGRRLAPLTRALYGERRPKQFAALVGRDSMLQATLRRIEPLFPRARTVVVVCEDHESLAREQLRPFRGVHLVVQPADLDTAPGMFCGLARVLARDRRARAVFFPSDHWIPRPDPFLDAVVRADAAVREEPGRVVLLGVVPVGPEIDYGWIVPGRNAGAPGTSGLREIEFFVEKPDPEAVASLFERGALWNAFVASGTAQGIWDLMERHLGDHADLFARCALEVDREGEAQALREAYSRMRSADFSRDVLEHAFGLSVVAVEGSGWCDWGSPERVVRSLLGTGEAVPLLRKVGNACADWLMACVRSPGAARHGDRPIPRNGEG